MNRLHLLLSCWLLPLGVLAAPGPFAQPELLEPAVAYRLSAVAGDGKVVVEWRIADGYYLYRDKLKFTSATPGITLADPELPPPSEVKNDPFFGQMAIYRGNVAIPITTTAAAGSGATVDIDVKSQGCADIGVCFPPETRRVSVALPAAPPQASPVGGASADLLAALGARLGISGDAPQFLDPDQAFVLTANPTADGRGIAATWQIADGYYLYRDKFAFTPLGDPAPRLGPAELPAGKVKEDPYFGKMEIYQHSVTANVPIFVSAAGRATDVRITASYQGCAEEGICYPPIQRELAISLPFIATAEAAPAAAQLAAVPAASLSEQDSIARSLASGSFLVTVLTFFGFGLLLAFTPCVFPMIPILSGIIVGHGNSVTTRKAFGLSLTYVLAMAVTYTAAGVVAGLFGSNLQATFQNPWILGGFSLVFVLLALAMFGFYDLQMPSWLQTKLSQASHSQRGGTLAGAGVMGVLSALIVGPCVAAPLAGALIYIGQTGDAVLGGAALFALSMGMGAPLLAIGTSAGRLMPRAGPWMETIKKVFGVLLLAVAIYLVERIVPGPVALLLWAALALVTAVNLGAFQPLPEPSSGWRKLWKGAGLLAMAYGVTLVIGAGRGNDDPLSPLAGIGFGGPGNAHVALPFKRVKSLDDMQREVLQAGRQGRTVMLDFYADWCVTCKQMERETFSDPAVQRLLANTTTLQADVTDNDAVDQQLLRHFGLIGPPSILFFGLDGQERRDYRVMGFMDADTFRQQVGNALQ